MSDRRWYEETMRDHEREIARRARIDRVLDVVVAVVFTATMIAVTWLYLAATPSQRSAECDQCAERFERTGGL